MSKTLPERLREAASIAMGASGALEMVCTIGSCFGADCGKYETDDCELYCARDALEGVAEEIELDYVRVPHFKSYDSRAAFVEYMRRICDKMDVVRTEFETDDLEVMASLKIICEPKPKDTLEAIERDAGLHYGDYIAAHPHVTTQREMVLDLLRRQREVLGRDGE